MLILNESNQVLFREEWLNLSLSLHLFNISLSWGRLSLQWLIFICPTWEEVIICTLRIHYGLIFNWLRVPIWLEHARAYHTKLNSLWLFKCIRHKLLILQSLVTSFALLANSHIIFVSRFNWIQLKVSWFSVFVIFKIRCDIFILIQVLQSHMLYQSITCTVLNRNTLLLFFFFYFLLPH